MLFKSSIVVAMATAAFGAIVPPLGGAPMSCLTPKPNTEQKAIHKQFAVAEASALASASSSITARATTYINTYIHVVSASKSSSDGYLSVCIIFVPVLFAIIIYHKYRLLLFYISPQYIYMVVYKPISNISFYSVIPSTSRCKFSTRISRVLVSNSVCKTLTGLSTTTGPTTVIRWL